MIGNSSGWGWGGGGLELNMNENAADTSKFKGKKIRDFSRKGEGINEKNVESFLETPE